MNNHVNNLSIVFVGKNDRVKALQHAAEIHNWKIRLVTKMTKGLFQNRRFKADLVILDNFPDSNLAKSVFFHLRSMETGPFLGLNDRPQAVKFLHTHGLSFLKILQRDPEPHILTETIVDLVQSHRKAHSPKAARHLAMRKTGSSLPAKSSWQKIQKSIRVQRSRL